MVIFVVEDVGGEFVVVLVYCGFSGKEDWNNLCVKYYNEVLKVSEGFVYWKNDRDILVNI